MKRYRKKGKYPSKRYRKGIISKKKIRKRKKIRRRKPLKEYITDERDISKTGLRLFYGHRARSIKRVKGRVAVDIKLTVYNAKGKKNRDIKGVKGLGLPRMRYAWRKEIGDYIHSQLREYNLYLGNYFSPKLAKQLRIKKSQKVKIQIHFKKIYAVPVRKKRIKRTKRIKRKKRIAQEIARQVEMGMDKDVLRRRYRGR